MKKTRILAIILAVVMIVTLISACGRKTEPEDASQTAETPDVTEQPKIEVDPTEIVVDDETGEETPAKDPYADFNLTPITDNSTCSIDITGIADTADGVIVRFSLTNKTDAAAIFACTRAVANRYEFMPFFVVSAEPGERVKESLIISKESIKLYQLSVIDELTFDIGVYSENDLDLDALYEGTFTVYPTGKTPDQIKYADIVLDDDDEIIVDNESFMFIIVGSKYDSQLDTYSLICYLQNKTNHSLMVTLDDVLIDGKHCDPYWAHEISANMKAYEEIGFYKEILDDLKIDISKISEINFKLTVYNSENWAEPNLIEESFCYIP